MRETDGCAFEAANRAYRLAGPWAWCRAVAAARPRSATRIDAFLASDERRARASTGRIGEAIDCRYYRVDAGARRRSAIADRCTRDARRPDLAAAHRAQPAPRDDDRQPDRAAQSRRASATCSRRRRRPARVTRCWSSTWTGSAGSTPAWASLVGDELLITVARRIKGALRARDVLARIGGDEFGILLAIDDDRERGASSVAERIRGALADAVPADRLRDRRRLLDRHRVRRRRRASDAEELIRHAQFAVKRAKASGAGRDLSDRRRSRSAREQFAMETALRRAIEQRRAAADLSADLRPRDRADRSRSRRWRAGRDEDGRECVADRVHPGRGGIGADRAARPLGDRRGGADAGGVGRARRAATAACRLAVNLSAIQLQRDAIAPVVAAALARHGLTGDRFTLELTESAIVADPDGIARDDARAEGARHDAGDGRFRHRLFEPRLSPEAADRHAQDRPQLRHRHARRPRQGGDRARDPQPGAGAGHADDGGGDRDAASWRRRWRRSAAPMARAIPMRGRCEADAALRCCATPAPERRPRRRSPRRGGVGKALGDPARPRPAAAPRRPPAPCASPRATSAPPVIGRRGRRPVDDAARIVAGEQQPVDRAARARRDRRARAALVARAGRAPATSRLRSRVRQLQPRADRRRQRPARQQRGQAADRVGRDRRPRPRARPARRAARRRRRRSRAARRARCRASTISATTVDRARGATSSLSSSAAIRSRDSAIRSLARAAQAARPVGVDRRRRSARGSGRSAGCAGDPRRCAGSGSPMKRTRRAARSSSPPK